MMLRIEAGLPLTDVEWTNSRLAFTDHDRVTPTELGMGWMLRGLADDDRAFLGGAAIRRELAEGTSRWTSVGIVVDWEQWNQLHRDAGLLPTKDEHPLGYELVLHDRATTEGGTQVGYVTSFFYPPSSSGTSGWPGSAPSTRRLVPRCTWRLLEPLEHHGAGARIAKTPLFNPARKTAKP